MSMLILVLLDLLAAAAISRACLYDASFHLFLMMLCIFSISKIPTITKVIQILISVLSRILDYGDLLESGVVQRFYPYSENIACTRSAYIGALGKPA